MYSISVNAVVSADNLLKTLRQTRFLQVGEWKTTVSLFELVHFLSGLNFVSTKMIAYKF